MLAPNRIALCLMLLLHGSSGAGNLQSARNASTVEVPVYPANQMLVVVTIDGIAAIKFDSPKDRGVRYTYRFLPSDGSEIKAGDGRVFEDYERIQVKDDPDVVRLRDRGSVLVISAADIRLSWSFGSEQFVWVYTTPEQERLHVVSSSLFEEIDLSRFRK